MNHSHQTVQWIAFFSNPDPLQYYSNTFGAFFFKYINILQIENWAPLFNFDWSDKTHDPVFPHKRVNKTTKHICQRLVYADIKLSPNEYLCIFEMLFPDTFQEYFIPQMIKERV